MAYPVIVPRESEEMELCQIIRWHVHRGERVHQGDVLCEVDTGKASFDIEAPEEGMVLDIFYGDNEEAPLLTPIAVIGEEGEEYAQFRPRSEPAVHEKDGSVGDTQDSGSEAPPERAGQSERLTAATIHELMAERERRGRFPVSPRARRLAARNGIPLHRVEGSGPGGAVVERDVMGWLRELHRNDEEK